MKPSMRRRSPGLDDVLSFGGRVPPAVGGLIVAFVGLSILSAVTGLVGYTMFMPGAVLAGQVWRLVTWPLVESAGPNTPINLLFGGLTLYWFGRDLVAYSILAAAALIDLAVYGRLKDLTVCYRCRGEFRGPINPALGGFELAVAEKYRHSN